MYVGKKWFRVLLRKRFFIALLLVLQLFVMVYTLASTSLASAVISRILTFISFLVCIYIVSRKDKGAYKLTWVFMILLFPVFGGLFYLIFNFQTTTKRFSKRSAKTETKAKKLLPMPGTAYKQFCDSVPQNTPQVKYLQDFAGFPIYAESKTEYLSPGERKLERLLEELQKAEKYIFLEYFIVQEGVMWDSVLDILKKKVKQGVKVRLMYDDVGCFFLLPKDYPKKLRKLGIECVVCFHGCEKRPGTG